MNDQKDSLETTVESLPPPLSKILDL